MDCFKLQTESKVVLVTGSSRGIGNGIAHTLHNDGYQVVLNGREATALEEAVASLTTSAGIVADVSLPDEAARLVTEVRKRFGRLDGLVCNVGSGRSVPPGEENYQEWQRVFATNFWSATNVVEASSDLLALNEGSIVCISSICGSEVVAGAPVTYSAAKAALNAYVKGVSRPLGKRGIRINAIAPGNVLFDGSVWEKKLKENPEEVQQMLETDVALEKLGSPQDVANLAAYLLSPKSSFATGAIWVCDGGQSRS